LGSHNVITVPSLYNGEKISDPDPLLCNGSYLKQSILPTLDSVCYVRPMPCRIANKPDFQKHPHANTTRGSKPQNTSSHNSCLDGKRGFAKLDLVNATRILQIYIAGKRQKKHLVSVGNFG